MDRLSSPEQLDQLLLTTRPQGWLALTALLLLLAIGVVWAVYGTVPTEVLGDGILLRRGGVWKIVAAEAGELQEIRVAPGDVLTAGQVVATLRQDEKIRQIQQAEQRVRGLREEVSKSERQTASEEQWLAELLAAERATLLASLEPLERNLEILRNRLAEIRKRAGEENRSRGDGDAASSTEQDLNTTLYRIATVQRALEQLDSRHFQETRGMNRRLAEQRALLREAEEKLKSLRDSLEEGGRILARTPCRVLEIYAHPGEQMASGSPILSGESLTGELQVLVYLPAVDAQQVRMGMEARVSPLAASRQEGGHLTGKVTSVGSFPVSSLAMQRVLGNDDLVRELTRAGPLVQIEIALSPDPAASAGNRPASAGAMSFEIASGTLVTAKIRLWSEHPFELLLPAVWGS